MKYHVQTAKRVGRTCTGLAFLEAGVLRIGTHERDGTERPVPAVTETFWHEALHTILHDMRHKLNHDEQFVTGVAKRIAQIVHTARF